MRIGSTSFGAPGLFWKWQFYREDGSASRLRVNAGHASQPCYALLDSQQAGSLHMPDIKALSVVLDDQRQAAGYLLHADANSARLGMPFAIMQCFLHYPIHTGLVFIRQIVGIEIGRDAHIHGRSL